MFEARGQSPMEETDDVTQTDRVTQVYPSRRASVPLQENEIMSLPHLNMVLLQVPTCFSNII